MTTQLAGVLLYAAIAFLVAGMVVEKDESEKHPIRELVVALVVGAIWPMALLMAIGRAFRKRVDP